MVEPKARRSRPRVRITHARASRLHQLLRQLAGGARTRDELREGLAIGLRTFYRELDLLRRCGIRVPQQGGGYQLRMSLAEAEGRLPFPDPQLTFAEMNELSRGKGPAARRLAELLSRVKQTNVARKTPKRVPKP